MDARELLDKKIALFRKKWADFASELKRDRERLEWLAEEVEIQLPDLPHFPDQDEVAEMPSQTVRPGQFYSMSQTDAVAAYLSMVRRPCTLEELIEVLQQGGLVFNSKDPRGTLYTQLVRATLRFVKLPTGQFDLLDNYPNEKAKRSKPRKPGGSSTRAGEPDTEDDEEEAVEKS